MANPFGYSNNRALARAWHPFHFVHGLASWDPFAEMTPASTAEPTWAPRFEVKGTKEAYLFRADLPGVAEKDLAITVDGNRLTISGKRESEQRREDETYYAYERSYGSFSRSFTLPDDADLDRVEAELTSGVLNLSVPKRPESQPRTISLKSVGEKLKSALGVTEKPSA